jgi:Rrf2 family nitric oxide-sensitive transcriptional repressor
MRLSKFTDYAFRVLILAASRNEPTTIDETAALYGISAAHLKKVVRTLTGAGILVAVRGRGGGFRLGKPAEKIGLGEVVRLTETDFALVECFQPGGSCPLAPACKLAGLVAEARDLFLRPFDQSTLADIAVPRVEEI